MNNKIEETIKKHHMIPKNLYERPMTSAHEIGWFSKPLVKLISFLYTNNNVDG